MILAKKVDTARLYDITMTLIGETSWSKNLLIEPDLSHIEVMLNESPEILHQDHASWVIHKYGETTLEEIIKEKRKRLAAKSKSK